MAQYTITIKELVENDVILFDFDYPFYNEQYRKTFEQHFIDNFYFDEIGQETVGKFKQRLKNKFNLILPYWNKILLADNLEQRILDNYDVTETYTRNVSNNTNATNDTTNKNLASDTPTTKVDFEQVDYFSSIVKDIGNNTSIINGDSEENWTRTMKGNIGIQTDSDSIKKYWESLRQIENEIFEQCSDLFMEVF